jgi:Ca2+-dependent lipid-binding protein
MKTLQDRMNDMKPYFRGIEMYNEAIMVKVVMPANWKCYPSSDGRIKVAPSDTDPNMTFYYANSNDTSYEDMFDLIEETIKANQDIVLKLKLLKEKVEELKEVFSSHSYEELQTLNFEFKTLEKAKHKRKYTKKNKEAEKQKEEPKIEENNNNEETIEISQ